MILVVTKQKVKTLYPFLCLTARTVYLNMITSSNPNGCRLIDKYEANTTVITSKIVLRELNNTELESVYM